MATKRGLAVVVALVALSGAALADSGAHYYMPSHRAGPHAKSGAPHGAGGTHRAQHGKLQHGKPQHGAKGLHKAQHPPKHRVK